MYFAYHYFSPFYISHHHNPLPSFFPLRSTTMAPQGTPLVKKSLKERSTHKFKSRPTSKKMRESALFPPSSLSLSPFPIMPTFPNILSRLCATYHIPSLFSTYTTVPTTNKKSETFPSLPPVLFPPVHNFPPSGNTIPLTATTTSTHGSRTTVTKPKVTSV